MSKVAKMLATKSHMLTSTKYLPGQILQVPMSKKRYDSHRKKRSPSTEPVNKGIRVVWTEDIKTVQVPLCIDNLLSEAFWVEHVRVGEVLCIPTHLPAKHVVGTRTKTYCP